MMSEEDEVFLSDSNNATSAYHDDYTRIYGNDDILATTAPTSTTATTTKPRTSSHTSDQSEALDTFDVYINNPRNKIQAKKKSLLSESSEEDMYDSVHIDRNGATKPLMYPRRSPVSRNMSAHQKRCQQSCRCVFYLVVMVTSLAALAAVIVYLVKNYVDVWLDIDTTTQHTNHTHTTTLPPQTIVGCTDITVEKVWAQGIPKLMTESAIRMVDVNEDGVLDVLFGFATGAEGYSVPPLVCDIYFSGLHPCLGGLLALDGATGHQIWRHYSPHEIFAVNCNEDLDGDGVKDCVIAGRVGTMEAVSGREGALLWNFTHPARLPSMNVYTGQYVRDLDGDGVRDILDVHGGDPFGEPGSETRLVGRLFLFSGADGSVLQWAEVPDARESYYSPVVCRRGDGTEVVVFGTGGETHPGSLWYILLDDLYKGDMHKAQQIVHNPYKGYMTPPVLLDLTGDGIEDLVFSSYNSTVLAVDGDSLTVLWNFTYPWSETYATPAPGFYNDDDVPDFIVHWQYGPGFPVYFHSITTVLDGRDGRPLITPYIRSSVGAQTSPITVSVEGKGHDLFLYWVADCQGHEGEGGDFTFIKGTNVHEQSRSDVCRLRFKSDGFSRYYVLNSQLKAPGVVLYDSTEHTEEERSAWINTTVEAQDYLRRHPEHLDNYAEWRDWVRQNIREKEQNPYLPQAADSDLGKHLQHSLDVITGQAADPRIDLANTRNKDRQYKPQYSDNTEDWKLFDSAPNTADNIEQDTNDYEYLKRLYDALEHDKTASKQNDPLQDILENFGENPKFVDRSGFEGSPKFDMPFDPKSWTGSSNEQGPHSRQRRHVGPHDEGGLQRLISTGTLAPPLLPPSHPSYPHSMDVIFATYWFYPAKTEAILPEDQECIDNRMAEQTERFDPNSQYYGMDDDAFKHVVTKECLAFSNHQLPDHGTYNNQHTYNPYNVHMGQLTMYRMRLKCKCRHDDMKRQPNSRCGSVLPYDRQQWAGYMGSEGTSHWRPPGG